MRQTISISIPDELKEELDQVSEQEGLSRSDVIRKSLQNYLFTRNFRALRNRMLAKAQARGIYTDRDVFDRVS